MKKAYLNLTFIITLIILISLFVYSGLEIYAERTESMEWKGVRFVMTDFTKIIGLILILSIPTFLFLKKKLSD